MRLTPSTLSKAATATTLDAYLTTLKATQLKALARATGIPSSGRKDVLRKRIGEGVEMSVFLPRYNDKNHSTKHGDTGKKELSVLSIDMGIQNLAVAHLLVRDGSSFSDRKGLVMLNAWHRIGVQELANQHCYRQQESGKSCKEKKEDEEPLQSILPAAAFRTFSTTQTQTQARKDNDKLVNTTSEEEEEEEENETTTGKTNFHPETLSLNAFILLSALLRAYNPTHILIERQRFRSGGQRAVLEWSLRVGVFEGMVHAVLRTMREMKNCSSCCCYHTDGLEEVYAISPARVMQFWDCDNHNGNDNEGSDETAVRKNAKNVKNVKRLKMDIIGELLLSLLSSPSSSSSSSSKSGSDDGSRIPLSALSCWDLDVNTASAGKVVDAYLARWNGSSSKGKRKKKTTDGSKQDKDRIEKLDDLADCLLQGLTWLEWQARRARLAGLKLQSI